MALNKVPLLCFSALLIAVASLTTQAQTCNQPTCAPVDGKCQTGYVYMEVGNGLCVRLQAEPAKVDIRDEILAPVPASQIALNETVASKPIQRPKIERKAFLEPKRSTINTPYNWLTWAEVGASVGLTMGAQVSTTRNNGFERNTLISDSNGRLSVWKHWAVSTGYMGMTLAVEKRSVLTARVLRYTYILIRAFEVVDNWSKSNRKRK